MNNFSRQDWAYQKNNKFKNCQISEISLVENNETEQD